MSANVFLSDQFIRLIFEDEIYETLAYGHKDLNSIKYQVMNNNFVLVLP